jgi:hypothetical protein
MDIEARSQDSPDTQGGTLNEEQQRNQAGSMPRRKSTSRCRGTDRVFSYNGHQIG